MNSNKKYTRYSDNLSANFVDEIIISETPTISKIFHNNFEIKSITKPNKNENKTIKHSQNFILNFSILSFTLIALILVFGKIVSTTFISFNSFSSSIFVGSYFMVFLFTIYVIFRRKMLTLKIKDGILFLKSFPALNQKIPINQILKCELNTITDGKYNSKNKIYFALNENGNRYKQLVTSGITIQLINGKHILITSNKSLHNFNIPNMIFTTK